MEARRRDQLVNFQVGNPNIQDKSMTSKHGNATKSEQKILRKRLKTDEKEQMIPE